MGKLLSDGQLASLQKVAKLAMQTTVRIYRRAVTTGLETSDPNPYGSSDAYALVATVKGMLHSEPTPVAQIDGGQLVTVNTYTLRLESTADITNGDRVTIGANTYVVADTTADETWPAILACSLRLAE